MRQKTINCAQNFSTLQIFFHISHVESIFHITSCHVENFSTWKSVMWRNFSTWQKNSPQARPVVPVTNIRYAICLCCCCCCRCYFATKFGDKRLPGYLETVFVPKLPKRRLRVADTARAGPGVDLNFQNFDNFLEIRYLDRMMMKIIVMIDDTHIKYWWW